MCARRRLVGSSARRLPYFERFDGAAGGDTAFCGPPSFSSRFCRSPRLSRVRDSASCLSLCAHSPQAHSSQPLPHTFHHSAAVGAVARRHRTERIKTAAAAAADPTETPVSQRELNRFVSDVVPALLSASSTRHTPSPPPLEPATTTPLLTRQQEPSKTKSTHSRRSAVLSDCTRQTAEHKQREGHFAITAIPNRVRPRPSIIAES